MKSRFQSSTPEYQFAGSIDVDRTLGPLINKYMCSSRCPCKDFDEKSAWESIGNLPLIQKYGRDPEKHPFKFDSKKGKYDNFRECFESAKSYKGKDAFFKFAKDVVNSQQYKESADFVSAVEDKFACSGFCTPNLFFFDKSISAGLPDEVSCTNKEQ